jgi:hypothetical protein
VRCWRAVRPASADVAPPLIGLQAAEAEPAAAGDPLRESRHGRTRRNAAAIHADVDFDERGQAQARVLGRGFERRDAGFGINANRRRADSAERGKTGKLAGAGDLVADENVADAAPGQDLRFGHLLHALADGAARHLEAGDDWRLVGLRVRSKLDASLARERRHVVEIALKGVEVDEKGGRVDLVDRGARFGGRRLKHDCAQAAMGRVVIESSRKLSRM